MRKIFKIITAFFLSVMFLFLNTLASANQYPDMVRIGLNYGYDAVSSVSVNAASGIDIGYSENGTFRLLIDQQSSQSLIIRKDGHFVRTIQGQVLEYSRTEGVPYEGTVIGPYHLKIGDNIPDYITAQSIITVLNKSGINAYIAFENGWQVWTGFYPDLKAAEDGLSHVKSVLGSENVIIVPESLSRLVIYDAGFNVVMVYGGVNGFLQVWPKQDNNPYIFSANGKRYRGYLEIRRYPDSDLTLINILNIEQYLYGVVPAEIEADAPHEAVKAQAVAARTFTYRNINKNEKWGFDLVDTVEAQVYNGYDSERASSNQAVDETRGEKILYSGSLAQINYFASSGGMTADIKEVWGSEIPYLVSVSDPYESETSSHYIWEKTLTAEEIKSLLFIKNVEIGDIISVSAEEYSPSGRVTALRITGTNGSKTYYIQDTRFIFNLNSQKYTIQSAGNVVVKASNGSNKTLALDGRSVISSSGISKLSSANTTVAVVGSGSKIHKISMFSNTYVFSGRGWGHGVGMSQEGAKGFARQGYTYDQILKHYYTGVTIE